MKLLDWKSSAYRSLEEELQLGGYFGCTHRWDASLTQWVDMRDLTPEIDEAAIVHVWEGGCRAETRLKIGDLMTAYEKFLEAKDLFDWMVAKGKVNIPENEAYVVNGRQYPSVTYIRDHVIAKPKLLNWAYEKGVEAGVWTNLVGAPHPDEGVDFQKALEVKTLLDAKMLKRTDAEAQPWIRLVEWIDECGQSATARRDGQGVKGTSLHKNILFYLQGRSIPLTDLSPYLRDSLTHFMGWAQRVKLKPRYLEQKLMNEELGYAGTADFLGEADLDSHPAVVKEPRTRKPVGEPVETQEAI